MSAQSRTYDDFLKFLGSKPHKLFSSPEERIKIVDKMYKVLTKTKESIDKLF